MQVGDIELAAWRVRQALVVLLQDFVETLWAVQKQASSQCWGQPISAGIRRMQCLNSASPQNPGGQPALFGCQDKDALVRSVQADQGHCSVVNSSCRKVSFLELRMTYGTATVPRCQWYRPHRHSATVPRCHSGIV